MVRRAGRTYTSHEYTDIHYYYGVANGNSFEAQRLYIDDFCGPKKPVYCRRRKSDSRVFRAVHNRISESASVFTITRERGTSNYYDEGDEVGLLEQIIALVTQIQESVHAILAVELAAAHGLPRGYQR